MIANVGSASAGGVTDPVMELWKSSVVCRTHLHK